MALKAVQLVQGRLSESAKYMLGPGAAGGQDTGRSLPELDLQGTAKGSPASQSTGLQKMEGGHGQGQDQC